LAWLLTIERNKVREAARKAGREGSSFARCRRVPRDLAECVCAPQPTPLDGLIRAERDLRIGRALDALDEEVYVLLVLQACKCPDEIAALVVGATSVVALRSRRDRIRARLRAQIDGDD
jgi:DNA-directed RNA polymerase specialized sigma24 family protein